MEMPGKSTQEFLQVLAMLFYAAAATDGKVVRPEKMEIIRILRENWPFPEDSKECEGIMYSRIKELIGRREEPESAFVGFSRFFTAHEADFTPALKDWVLSAVRAIVSASARTNKSEMILLTRLNLLFSGR